MKNKYYKKIERKAYICKKCEGVYADEPVTQCDCMPSVDEFWIGTIVYLRPTDDSSLTKSYYDDRNSHLK